MANKDDLKIEEPKKEGNKLILVIGAALLGIGVGAIGVYFAVGGSEPEGTAEATLNNVQSIYQKVEKPFIVNFNAKGKQRYLQIDVTFKGKDQNAFDMLVKHAPVIKNNLNLLFSEQQLEVLQTEAGREALIADATKIVQQFLEKELGAPGIEQVLFTDFIMQ